MPPNPSCSRRRELLQTPLATLHGVGPKLAEKLARAGLRTVEDALYHLPHRYEDRRELRRIARLRDGRNEVFTGEILAAAETRTQRSGRRLFEVVVADGSGQVALKWFHYRAPWMKTQYRIGRKVVVSGELKRFGSQREIHHPDIEFLPPGETAESWLRQDPLGFGRLLPVYPLTEGLHQKTLRKILHQAVEHYAVAACSPLPDQIRERHGLLPVAQALAAAHWPPPEADAEALAQGRDLPRRSLVFDEFFFLQLGLALRRRGAAREPGIAFTVTHRYTRPLAAMLPYRLTAAQRRVLGEIKQDMMAPHPMNRLLQGDVGSGKTIVALMAALVAIENGCQVAVVAPTEILAEQHYVFFSNWLEKLNLCAGYLASGMVAGERRKTLERIADGSIQLVVGTHAVLQQGVEFQRLGLGIIDEQHRFGVRQRGILKGKGTTAPDMLVMTATPIPRTLAMTLYGDLALSVIDELPPGRQPVKTHVIDESRREGAFRLAREELAAGRQVYVVYPLVEESEKSDLKAATEAATQLQREIFPQHRVGLLHGRLAATDKEAVMRAFRERELDVLVATTVIEVGIDIPNATVMMIEHAERFGLAQLHQLRGRVGRGEGKSVCLLIRGYPCSDDARRRLEVMAQTQDGFRIAEADLEIRGPGELLGTRQAGLPDFRVASLLRDAAVLELARQEAFQLVEKADVLTGPEYAELRETLRERWAGRFELASIA